MGKVEKSDRATFAVIGKNSDGQDVCQVSCVRCAHVNGSFNVAMNGWIAIVCQGCGCDIQSPRKGVNQ